jgi:hypothetical protein
MAKTTNKECVTSMWMNSEIIIFTPIKARRTVKPYLR